MSSPTRPVKCSHATCSVTFLYISSTTNECSSDLQAALPACMVYWRPIIKLLIPLLTPVELVIGVGPLSQNGPHFADIIIVYSLPQIPGQLLLNTACTIVCACVCGYRYIL